MPARASRFVAQAGSLRPRAEALFAQAGAAGWGRWGRRRPRLRGSLAACAGVAVRSAGWKPTPPGRPRFSLRQVRWAEAFGGAGVLACVEASMPARALRFVAQAGSLRPRTSALFAREG